MSGCGDDNPDDERREEVGTAGTKGGKVASKKPTADLTPFPANFFPLASQFPDQLDPKCCRESQLFTLKDLSPTIVLAVAYNLVYT